MTILVMFYKHLLNHIITHPLASNYVLGDFQTLSIITYHLTPPSLPNHQGSGNSSFPLLRCAPATLAFCNTSDSPGALWIAVTSSWNVLFTLIRQLPSLYRDLSPASISQENFPDIPVEQLLPSSYFLFCFLSS